MFSSPDTKGEQNEELVADPARQLRAVACLRSSTRVGVVLASPRTDRELMAEKRVRLVIERAGPRPLRWKLALFAVLVILLARWSLLMLPVLVLGLLVLARRRRK
jgi:hypothetical protein